MSLAGHLSIAPTGFPTTAPSQAAVCLSAGRTARCAAYHTHSERTGAHTGAQRTGARSTHPPAAPGDEASPPGGSSVTLDTVEEYHTPRL